MKKITTILMLIFTLSLHAQKLPKPPKADAVGKETLWESFERKDTYDILNRTKKIAILPVSSAYYAKIAGYSGIALCVGISVFTALLLLIFPEQMVSIYTSDSIVTQIAVSLLFLAAVFQISDALQVSSLGALRGLKDTTIPMIVNLIAYWVVGLPSGYLLGITLKLGPNGLWIGLILGLSVAALLHTWRFYILSKRQTIPV